MTPSSNPGRLIVLLAALVAFAPLSIDTYLPSLPAIASDLGADAAHVQLTISLFLAGLCLGMLVYGPLSDRYGRRPLLLGGMGLYLLATVGCMFAGSVEQLVAWRFFQALGGAAASVLARAIVRDLFPLGEAAKVLSLMHLVTMLATLVAPLLGSLLMDLSGWRTVFLALLLFCAICLLASALKIAETHAPEQRGESLGKVFLAYWQIARQPLALGYILCMGLAFGGMFAFITASPFVYMEYFGVSPRGYAWLFGLNIAGIIVMTLINARFVGRLGPLRMLALGASLAGVAALGLLAVGLGGWGGLGLIVAWVVLYVSVTGLLGANCVASLLALYPRQAGAAAGLAVACQFALGAGFSAAVSALADGTPRPMCLTLAVAGLGCLLCYGLIARRSRRQAVSQTA
ncbi:Bcr/CflA family multidrug efflux MFS transporter [Pseudomonas japonica]|uniref:Bcr/CflA family efflux transporter n=1 Tax=Pseudomonas japonica TaxID=256466 RepID=A0A239K751_9PSED|nr:Bcr/CflA family multidrug efflux MFS transporter [Pseudomonas japonica]SNT13790.1 MFS transporter, DHA1 family, bicyclomycin/chloramphenicol resistance protein [Pseudomonas japonica]